MTKTAEDRSAKINEGVEHHFFDAADNKGRRVGADVSFQVQVFVEVPDLVSTHSNVPAGTYFCWMGNATRAGEAFGASQTWNRCKTEAERFEQVAKYLKGAEARANKNFG